MGYYVAVGEGLFYRQHPAWRKRARLQIQNDVFIGSNTAESHPVLATRIKRAHKLHGQKMIVSDLRRNEMAERADILLQPQPGTDLVWLGAVSRYILDNGLAKMDFVCRNRRAPNRYH